jgi:hypothetical protein
MAGLGSPDANPQKQIVSVANLNGEYALGRFLLGHRHCFPVRLGCVGCSFHFGRTSILFPRLPHSAQTTRGLNDGTSVSAG